VHLNELIVEVLLFVQLELETHQITLQIETFEGLPPVMGERVQLQQVLLNLIRNAMDAMSSITNRKRVLAIKSEVSEYNEVLLTIEDSGTGIDPDHINHIFHAFFTTKAHGMGMGLSICRSIIESHGGKLWASARSPHGSMFWVKLPSIVSE
jgi:signal transduction histidine kinase